MSKDNRNRKNKRNINRNKIKEVIYVDEPALNSILSQLDGGLSTAIELTNQILSGNQEQHSNSNNTGGSLGFSGSSVAHNTNKSNAITQIQQEMSQEIIKTIYNDHAINIVQEKLLEKDNLVLSDKAKNGDITKVKGEFVFFNPRDLLKTINFMIENKELLDIEDNGFAKVVPFFEFIESSLANTNIIVFPSKKSVIISKNENFRITEAQLKMIQARESKMTVLGTTEKILTYDDFSLDPGDNETEFMTYKASSKLINFMLKELEILDINSKIIFPIAIYFE